MVSSHPSKISAPKTSAGTTKEICLWLWPLSVPALAALLFFLRLGARALWGPEGRWAEIAREMQLTGNYFWPTINGNPYYDKPLLSYWLVTGATHLAGGMSEAAGRLPSAAAGLLGVALLLLLARRLYGRSIAMLAGSILATSYGYVFFPRTASADMETVAGVLAALTLFLYHEEQQERWWVVGLWLVMAVTSLTKGLEGFVLPLFIIGVYSLLTDGWRSLLKRVYHGTSEEKVQGRTERCEIYYKLTPWTSISYPNGISASTPALFVCAWGKKL